MHDLHHVGEAQERNVGEVLEADLEDRFGGGDEAVIAVDVSGIELLDLRVHARRVAGVVEHAPIGEAHAIERIDRHELEALAHVHAAQREQFFEHERRGDHGRSAVEREARVLVDIRATARRVAFVDERHAEAARLQANGRGDPAEARPDDDHAWSAEGLMARRQRS